MDQRETQRRNENERIARALATNVIRSNQLLVSEAKLRLGLFPAIEGVVFNKSDTPLSAFLMRVTVTDCKTPFEDLLPKRAQTANPCGIIGEDASRVYVDVPPGQKRAFTASLNLPNLPKADQLQWFFTIEETTASLR